MRVSNTVQGSEIPTFWTDSDGTWQAITLPATLKNSREVMIQVHDGTSESYAHAAVEFEISGQSDGSGWLWVQNTISIGIGKNSEDNVICYVKAATGQKIAVMVLR